MDVGKFKASRGRLISWVILPPVLIVGIGLSSFALSLESEWELERTRVLAELLPKVEEARKEADNLIVQYRESDTGSVTSEDELISFLQNIAQQTGFTVDTLKVERRGSSAGHNVPVLTAHIRGSGTMLSLQNFIADAGSRQQLLSERALKISQGGQVVGEEICRADITFELALFKMGGDA